MNSIIGIIICIVAMIFGYASGYKDGREAKVDDILFKLDGIRKFKKDFEEMK